MKTYRVNSFTATKGTKEIGTLIVGKGASVAEALRNHGYIRCDAVVFSGKGLTVVVTKGSKLLLDEI